MNTFEIAVPSEIAFHEAPHGVTITRSSNNYIEFAAGGRNWPIYVISAISSVSLGVLSTYLYDTIKPAIYREPKTIRIEAEEVGFERGEIQRVLRHTITIKE